MTRHGGNYQLDNLHNTKKFSLSMRESRHFLGDDFNSISTPVAYTDGGTRCPLALTDTVRRFDTITALWISGRPFHYQFVLHDCSANNLKWPTLHPLACCCHATQLNEQLCVVLQHNTVKATTAFARNAAFRCRSFLVVFFFTISDA